MNDEIDDVMNQILRSVGPLERLELARMPRQSQPRITTQREAELADLAMAHTATTRKTAHVLKKDKT